jgi:hypothetical protein
MHIFKYNEQGGVDSDESTFTRLSASVSDGNATITRRIYFVADSRNEDAADVMALECFPKKYSAHPRHPAYKYYGNASIQPLSDSSMTWYADLEYTAENTNSVDMNGNEVTKDTPPWELFPDNYNISYPEVTIPFTAAYDENGNIYDRDGKTLIPVQNSAGSPLKVETVRFNFKMSFQFAVKKWDLSNSFNFGNTINARSERICGIVFPAGKALMLPIEATPVTVFEEDTNKLKWEYWNINVTILADPTEQSLAKYIPDVGHKAKFKSFVFKDDLIEKGVNLPETKIPSQICRIRKTKKETFGVKNYFFPTGDIVFLSWEQYLLLRKTYIEESKKLVEAQKMDSLYELQCEQEKDIPLKNGYVYTEAIDGHPDYKGEKFNILKFRCYPYKNWQKLNLPKERS